MADMVDQANEHADYLLQVALAKRPVSHAASALECEDCGEDIPQARRVAVPGCRRCADCQGLAEVRRG